MLRGHRPAAPDRGRAGFTLVEIMLVVVIVGIAATIGLPVFLRSLEGAKLRTSVRTVVMLHRFARSSAVLKQEHIALQFDTATQELEMISAKRRRQGLEGGFIDDAPAREPEETNDKAETLPGEEEVKIEKEVVRRLEDGVKIIQFEVQKEGQEHDGRYWVNYFPNGMCDRYALYIEDGRMNRARIEVDSVSGKIDVTYE